MRASPEAIQAAGEVYGAILANPERRAEIVRDLAALDAKRAAEAATSSASRPVLRGTGEARSTTTSKSA